jgi:hypothetical protein
MLSNLNGKSFLKKWLWSVLLKIDYGTFLKKIDS